MVRSMTGYGRKTTETDHWKVTIEMRSVNNRFLDVIIKMPRQYIALEDSIRKEVSAVLNRGHVDVFVTVEEIGEKSDSIAVDMSLARKYCNAMKEISEGTGLPYQLNIMNVATYSGVLTAKKEEADLDDLWITMCDALRGSLDRLLDMRILEGERLAGDLRSRMDLLADIRNQIEARSPIVVADHRERLRERICEYLGEVEIDRDKLLNEVAIFADRSDITEELTRLKSHFEQFAAGLAKSEPVGRKLDFIVQEINREINTIGSKANDMEIGRLVIEAKGEVEKIREQVQNFE